MTTLDNKMHGFQSGDIVTFKEVNGMMSLNGGQSQIEGKHMHSCINFLLAINVHSGIIGKK